MLARKRGVVQTYIANPLLINGYKFDLRIYVVVLSYDPLKVFIFDEGLVRLATQKYSTDPSTLESRTMHLTNYSVNKQSPLFVQNRDGRDAGEAAEMCDGEDEGPQASKWSLAQLKEHFAREGRDYDAMFGGIKDLVIKTLIGVEPTIREEWVNALGGDAELGWTTQGQAGAHPASCFEMYGFDVLVDANLQPWLLEVNICPSLSSGSPLDKRIKTKLVADTLTLVGIRPPRAVWKHCTPTARSSLKRPSSDSPGSSTLAEEKEGAPGCSSLSVETMAERAAKLDACATPVEALGLFDEAAWDMVLDCHDEDMRSGGLQRIFPAANGVKYTQFFEKESYRNLVLRKWHEAGGAELFKAAGARSVLPPSVPRLVSLTPS